MTPRILIIAGSDSGGGAGIQADIKTVTMLGGHAMTAVTAITAQNTLGVSAVHPIPTDIVLAQIDAVVADIGVDAVKIGMIGSAETAHAVAARLEALPHMPVVFDPVMVATSGAVLADEATIAAFERLMRRATLVTPNVPELAALQPLPPTLPNAGEPLTRFKPARGEAASMHKPSSVITTPTPSVDGPPELGERERRAIALALRVRAAVLAKGGDAAGATLVDLLVTAAGEVSRWQDARLETPHTHGTGCTLASAVATGLARGLPLRTAIERARLFVRLAIRQAPGFGKGHGPMGHQAVRLDITMGGAMPNQVTLPLTDYAASHAFYQALGLTPIVGSAPRYARFEAPGGMTLSIEAEAQVSAPTLYFECSDLDGTVARLRAAGHAVGASIDQSWGWREARLHDPAGNPLCLYQAGENRRFPPWRIDA